MHRPAGTKRDRTINRLYEDCQLHSDNARLRAALRRIADEHNIAWAALAGAEEAEPC